jgi:hypothetical protein
MATHTGMTTDEFDGYVDDWVKKGKHPRFKRPYTDLVYQPMLEVLAYLRANGFKTFIVSGGIEFMPSDRPRVWRPPQQIVGSSVKVVRSPTANPCWSAAADQLHRRRSTNRSTSTSGDGPSWRSAPDGDFEMLSTTAGRAAVRLIVHRMDARRWAYDPTPRRPARQGPRWRARRWLLMDMKKDWKVIYRSEVTDLWEN